MYVHRELERETHFAVAHDDAETGAVIKSHAICHLPDMTRETGPFTVDCDELKYERFHQFLKARHPNYGGDKFDVAMLNLVRHDAYRCQTH